MLYNISNFQYKLEIILKIFQFPLIILDNYSVITGIAQV